MPRHPFKQAIRRFGQLAPLPGLLRNPASVARSLILTGKGGSLGPSPVFAGSPWQSWPLASSPAPRPRPRLRPHPPPRPLGRPAVTAPRRNRRPLRPTTIPTPPFRPLLRRMKPLPVPASPIRPAFSGNTTPFPGRMPGYRKRRPAGFRNRQGQSRPLEQFVDRHLCHQTPEQRPRRLVILRPALSGESYPNKHGTAVPTHWEVSSKSFSLKVPVGSLDSPVDLPVWGSDLRSVYVNAPPLALRSIGYIR